MKIAVATEPQIVQLRRHAVNDVTREIMARGIKLTWDQAEALGDETIGWMSGRLGLNRLTSDMGVIFTPPEHYASTEAYAASRAEQGSAPKTQSQIVREVDALLATDKGTVRKSRSWTDRKGDIENRAISGLPLSGEAVASLSRDRGSMRLRHVWPDDTDARTWHGVRRAFLNWAQEVANTTRKPVEVYAKEGFMLEQVQPDR